jgi:hypothetical protein
MPALLTRAASPSRTVRSGALFILSPNSSPTPMARAPNLNKGRSSRASRPGVRSPRRRAAAMLAIGVMDRALATAPMREEKIKPVFFMLHPVANQKPSCLRPVTGRRGKTRDRP